MAELMADPPFSRGRTAGVSSTQGSSFIGVEKWSLDEEPRPGGRKSNRIVKCVAIRNTSGSALLPKQLVKFKASALLTEVDGTADNTAGLVVGVVDEYLPAAGCPVGDVCWVVVKGPTTVLKTTTAISTAGTAVGASTTAGSVAAGSGVGVTLEAAGSGVLEVRVLLTLPHG